MFTPSLLALATFLLSHPHDLGAGAIPPPRPEPASTYPGSASQGISSSDWSGIRAAYEANRHRFFVTGLGWQARNPGQGWTTSVDGRGFLALPDSGAWIWGLELVGYGWGNTQCVASKHPTVTIDGGRLRRAWDHRLTEWYVNDQNGLEHGFTITERPSDVTSSLSLELTIRGALHPVVSKDGRDVHFVGSEGRVELTYSGLIVLDSLGHKLAARYEPSRFGLRLTVDDQSARYPLTIDPIAQQAYLKASNTGSDDQFGFSVSTFGDTVVVGAPFEDSAATGVNGDQSNNAAASSGAAYVFVRSGATWSQQAYLKASNCGAGDQFGTSVAISGDTVVVGAWFEASNATGVNGNEANNSASNAGAAYVFVRNGGVWSQQAYLKASNTGALDEFGTSVAASGDTVVVGAWFEDSSATGVNSNQMDNSGTNSGAAYVFVRSGVVWSQQAYLKASNTGAGDFFSKSVAIHGDTVIVGSHQEDSNATGVNGNQSDNSGTDSGAAYVFFRTGGLWSQQAYLKASNTGAFDEFGFSVAVSGDTVIVGAEREDSNATGVNGNQANNSSGGSGAAYVFIRSGAVWTQQAYLKASNTGSFDEFGYSVAISGDTAVIGANGEDSNATGINGNQADNSAFDSGAVYVLVRAGGVWSQQGYIKASNTQEGDLFGSSVSISGDFVVVGAWAEDSNATGVNGNQANNTNFAAGASYIFGLGNNIGTAVYGTGTPGCAGTHTLGVTHAPMIGSPNFGITSSNAPPSSLGLGFLANAPDFAGSDPFFIGVLLHVDLFASTETVSLDFFSDASGNGLAAAPIPNAPALVGSTYYVMALWAWTTCSLPPYNLSTSQGLAMTVLVP